MISKYILVETGEFSGYGGAYTLVNKYGRYDKLLKYLADEIIYPSISIEKLQKHLNHDGHYCHHDVTYCLIKNENKKRYVVITTDVNCMYCSSEFNIDFKDNLDDYIPNFNEMIYNEENETYQILAIYNTHDNKHTHMYDGYDGYDNPKHRIPKTLKDIEINLKY